ncbi:MAG: ABC transporter permease [Bdellovibrionales bacterium]|nr:ABC transporter permease [Bdellovibrionales bacterium]
MNEDRLKQSSNIQQFLKMLKVLTFSELKARYRQTFAGLIWVIVNPIAVFIAHAVVFKIILKIDVNNYFIFLLSGILPWIFITSTLSMGINVFVQRGDLLKSFKINPFILLWSKVLDNFINFIIAFTLLLIGLSFLGEVSLSGIVFLPVSILILIVGTYSLLFVLSIAQVFYRDVIFVNQFILSLVYLLTPIFYPESFIPEDLRWVLIVNPFYSFIRPFQICFWEFNLTLFINSLTQPMIFILGFNCFGYFQWRKKANEFYLRI